jgi:hypothetical protein
LRELAAERYTRVVRRFDDTMKKGLSAAKLRALWTQLGQRLGAYQRHTVQKQQVKGDHRVVMAELVFARGKLRAVLTFDSGGRVAGFYLRPVKPGGGGAHAAADAWKPPPYAQAEQVREIAVTVGTGARALPGRLTVPTARGGRRCPAVVLVHGSGPQDMDETLGPNKPFKDLAWGLAARGIAVLRYTKGTKAHPDAAAARVARGDFTADHETTNDALKAAKQLRAHPLVQPGRVYVLGHSQGAMMAPRIGARDPALAGLILLAGPTRPLAEVALAQYRYIAGAGGPQAAAMKKRLPAFEKAVARLEDPKLSADTPADELPLGIPASFWLDLRGYAPARRAAKLKMPLLILQGEADYQVTMEDFAGWKKALRGKANATLKSYPQLGHTFIDLDKQKAMPTDYYQVKGHVDPQVIRDIAGWIRGHAKPAK